MKGQHSTNKIVNEGEKPLCLNKFKTSDTYKENNEYCTY